MNKRTVIGCIAVYIGMNVLNILIHSVLLKNYYYSDPVISILRPSPEVRTWIYFVTSLVASYFFVVIFSKGYEKKGIGEGIRYGLYIGLFFSFPTVFDSYASYPLPASLAIKWFFYSILEYIILGVVIAMVFGVLSKEP
jgi:hypothetical protein